MRRIGTKPPVQTSWGTHGRADRNPSQESQLNVGQSLPDACTRCAPRAHPAGHRETSRNPCTRDRRAMVGNHSEMAQDSKCRSLGTGGEHSTGVFTPGGLVPRGERDHDAKQVIPIRCPTRGPPATSKQTTKPNECDQAHNPFRSAGAARGHVLRRGSILTDTICTHSDCGPQGAGAGASGHRQTPTNWEQRPREPDWDWPRQGWAPPLKHTTLAHIGLHRHPQRHASPHPNNLMGRSLGGGARLQWLSGWGRV